MLIEASEPQPCGREYANVPICSHVRAARFKRFRTARADKARNERQQERCALTVRKVVVPSAHEGAKDRAGAFGMIRPRLASDIGDGFHRAGFDMPVAVLGVRARIQRLDFGEAGRIDLGGSGRGHWVAPSGCSNGEERTRGIGVHDLAREKIGSPLKRRPGIVRPDFLMPR